MRNQMIAAMMFLGAACGAPVAEDVPGDVASSHAALTAEAESEGALSSEEEISSNGDVGTEAPSPLLSSACSAFIQALTFNPKDPGSYPGSPVPGIPGPGLGNPNFTGAVCYTCCALARAAGRINDNQNLDCQDCCDGSCRPTIPAGSLPGANTPPDGPTTPPAPVTPTLTPACIGADGQPCQPAPSTQPTDDPRKYL